MKILQHKFVETIPDDLKDGILYISIPYDTMMHKCCCGCGNEVVTPLSLTQWNYTYNGKTITIDPSIGNWSLRCKSHYYIIKNKVIWSGKYNDEEIDLVRRTDFEDISDYYQENPENGRNGFRSVWGSLFSRKS